MGKARLELAQAIGRSISALGVWRSFDGVDVKMIRKRIWRVQLQYRIKRGDDLLSAWVCFTFQCPLVPRPKVHHRSREQRTHIDVLWKSLPDFTHRVGISLIERAPVV